MNIPVLELRFPVASRYSKGLVKSAPELNILIMFSACKPLSLLLFLSMVIFTDTSQAVSLSCEEILRVKSQKEISISMICKKKFSAEIYCSFHVYSNLFNSSDQTIKQRSVKAYLNVCPKTLAFINMRYSWPGVSTS